MQRSGKELGLEYGFLSGTRSQTGDPCLQFWDGDAMREYLLGVGA